MYCWCCRLFEEGSSSWNKESPNRSSLGSIEFNSQQQQQPEAPAPPLAPSLKLPSSTQQAAASTSDDSKGAEAEADLDPLHDSQSDSEKEAEQLSALSRVIQQQQDTITKQVTLRPLCWMLSVPRLTRHCSYGTDQACCSLHKCMQLHLLHPIALHTLRNCKAGCHLLQPHWEANRVGYEGRPCDPFYPSYLAL